MAAGFDVWHSGPLAQSLPGGQLLCEGGREYLVNGNPLRLGDLHRFLV